MDHLFLSSLSSSSPSALCACSCNSVTDYFVNLQLNSQLWGWLILEYSSHWFIFQLAWDHSLRDRYQRSDRWWYTAYALANASRERLRVQLFTVPWLYLWFVWKKGRSLSLSSSKFIADDILYSLDYSYRPLMITVNFFQFILQQEQSFCYQQFIRCDCRTFPDDFISHRKFFIFYFLSMHHACEFIPRPRESITLIPWDECSSFVGQSTIGFNIASASLGAAANVVSWLTVLPGRLTSSSR